MKTEEIFVDFGVGQVVARDVAQRAQPFENVVRVRILDDFIRNLFTVVEIAFVVVERRQVAVDHFGVVANSNLTQTNMHLAF